MSLFKKLLQHVYLEKPATSATSPNLSEKSSGFSQKLGSNPDSYPLLPAATCTATQGDLNAKIPIQVASGSRVVATESPPKKSRNSARNHEKNAQVAEVAGFPRYASKTATQKTTTESYQIRLDRYTVDQVSGKDKKHFAEAKRVFSDAFPPKFDPLAEHVSSSPVEPSKTMSVNQACQFLLDKFRHACPASADRSKQGGVLRDVLEKYALSDERKIDSLMLADWPSSGRMKPDEAIRRFVRRGWCGLFNIDHQEALRTLYRDSRAAAIDAAAKGEFLGEQAPFDGDPVDPLALAAHFTNEGMAAEIRAAHERFIAGQRAEHEAIKEIKGLSVPIRYEGPSTAKTRSFMTAEDFILVVDKSIIWAADQFRVLLEPEGGTPALEVARVRSRRTMRGVEHVGNVLRIVSGSADPRRIPMKVRDLVAKLKGQGFKFDTDDAALLVTPPGDDIADEDLHAILSNVWPIRGLERVQ